MVKRYTCNAGYTPAVKASEWEMVLYSDYKRVEAELEITRKTVDVLMKQAKAMKSKNKRLEIKINRMIKRKKRS